ncbi:Rid family hydrolase [Streptomyces sp. ME03-5709C]|nr:Rid family hydrolase [Streptomyces sp. ME03-5709C]
MSKAVHTDTAPQPVGAYSQARIAGPFIYTAGMGPLDPATGRIVEGDITRQTHLVIDHLEQILRQAGASLDDVVKVTAHLQHLDRDFPGFDAAYRERFGDPAPARTTVGSDLANILVEIDVVAYRG